MGGRGSLPGGRRQAPRRHVRDLRAAAERDRGAAHGPRAERLAPGRPDPLAPDARLRHAVAARLRPRRHRDPERRREGARARKERRGRSSAARRSSTHLAPPRGDRRDDHGPVPVPRRLARLQPRALYDGRRLRRGRDALLRPPLGPRLDLSRRADRQLVPVPRDRDLRSRGRARRHGRHAHACPLSVRGRLRAHHDRDRAARDHARRRRRRRPSRATNATPDASAKTCSSRTSSERCR